MMFRNRFDDDEDEDDRKDSEFTLGLGSLLGIFFGLVLLCGLFFGFGYSLGHGRTTVKHNNPSAATPETPATTAANNSSGSSTGSKPTAQQVAPPPPAPADPNPAETATPAANSGTQPASSQTTPAPPQQTNTQSANTQSPPPQQSANTGAAQQVFQNAAPLTPSQQASIHHYMVQVAALSRPRDASVLVAALEQRGFRAITRSEPGDNLMHVQIGPFNSLAAANQMRARLKADGYNAILKP